MVGRERFGAAYHAAYRTVRRAVRAHFYWRGLHRQLRNTSVALARYEAECRRSPLWRPRLEAPPIGLPPLLYHALWSAVESVIDPAVSARHRRLENLFRSSDRVARDRPPIDPLITPEGWQIQGALAKRVFRQLLGLRLQARELAVIRRYGSLDTAIRDLLAHSGFGQRVPDFAPLALDVQSFATFAVLRHQRLVLISQGQRARERRFDLTELWIGARAAARQLYWRRRDRGQQTEWEDARRFNILNLQDKLRMTETESDRKQQYDCAIHIAHEVFGSAMARTADLTEQISAVDPAYSNSDAHGVLFSNTLDAVAHHLSDTMVVFDEYLRRS